MLENMGLTVETRMPVQGTLSIDYGEVVLPIPQAMAMLELIL